MKIIDDNGKEIEFKKTNLKKSDDTLTVVQMVNPLSDKALPYELRLRIEEERQGLEGLLKEHGVNAIVLIVPDKNHFAKFDTLKKTKTEQKK